MVKFYRYINKFRTNIVDFKKKFAVPFYGIFRKFGQDFTNIFQTYRVKFRNVLEKFLTNFVNFKEGCGVISRNIDKILRRFYEYSRAKFYGSVRQILRTFGKILGHSTTNDRYATFTVAGRYKRRCRFSPKLQGFQGKVTMSKVKFPRASSLRQDIFPIFDLLPALKLHTVDSCYSFRAQIKLQPTKLDKIDYLRPGRKFHKTFQ